MALYLDELYNVMKWYRDDNYVMPSLLKTRDSGFKVFVDVFGPSLCILYNNMLLAVFGKLKIGTGGVSSDKFMELYTHQTVRIRDME